MNGTKSMHVKMRKAYKT